MTNGYRNPSHEKTKNWNPNYCNWTKPAVLQLPVLFLSSNFTRTHRPELEDKEDDGTLVLDPSEDQGLLSVYPLLGLRPQIRSDSSRIFGVDCISPCVLSLFTYNDIWSQNSSKITYNDSFFGWLYWWNSHQESREGILPLKLSKIRLYRRWNFKKTRQRVMWSNLINLYNYKLLKRDLGQLL